MILCADSRRKLGLKVLPEIAKPEVGDLLRACLVAVQTEMAVTGLAVASIEVRHKAHFGDDSGPLVREADAYVYEDAGCRSKRLVVTLRLVVDLGEPGDTAMTMALQLAASREDGADFLLSRRLYAQLDQHKAEDMDAPGLIRLALARLLDNYEGQQALCTRLAHDFCTQLAEELVP